MRSFFMRPLICSGDQRIFRCSTTYTRIASFLRRLVRPRFFRFLSARSCARRGVYRLGCTGLFRLISLATDDGDRLSLSATHRIDRFFHKNRCIFSRSSTEKCLYCMLRYFNGVLHLLVELTYSTRFGKKCYPNFGSLLLVENTPRIHIVRPEGLEPPTNRV